MSEANERRSGSADDCFCQECGAKQSYALVCEWFVRYAEILGCDARPSSVVVAIQALHDEIGRCRKSISRHRKAAYEQGLLAGRSTDRDA